MEAVAKLKKCPTSPRKMRLVADLIRGKGVNEALNVLKFTPNEPAGRLEKLLISAIHNWGGKNDLRPEDHDLIIKAIFVDSGKMQKRLRPAPYGRAHRIRKRSNHVTIKVDSKIPVDFEVGKTAEAAKSGSDDSKKENEA